MKLLNAASGLTPRTVLETLSAIRMVDVCILMTDGRFLVMPHYIEPDANQRLVLNRLDLALPPQSPPCIRGGDIVPPPTSPTCSTDLDENQP